METKTVDIPHVISLVRSRLAELCQERGTALEIVEEENHRIEDDWLYITVAPSIANVRVSDYASIMAQIEKELREQGIDNVLLIPVVPD